ncbi:hypothetical protein [Tunturiibacter lichenicola]|uniref:hypothetical protein n=1 Tax=Tunturiibacter lichenicola TaxID=2051959 RepID=UPI0021B26EB6|nr:hypothetical protein [Edaphobacter lichenicola]
MARNHQNAVPANPSAACEIPKWKTTKINSEYVSHFSALETWLLKHHVHHTSHQQLTIKTPRFDTRFHQKTQQNTQSYSLKKIRQTSFLSSLFFCFFLRL